MKKKSTFRTNIQIFSDWMASRVSIMQKPHISHNWHLPQSMCPSWVLTFLFYLFYMNFFSYFSTSSTIFAVCWLRTWIFLTKQTFWLDSNESVTVLFNTIHYQFHPDFVVSFFVRLHSQRWQQLILRIPWLTKPPVALDYLERAPSRCRPRPRPVWPWYRGWHHRKFIEMEHIEEKKRKVIGETCLSEHAYELSSQINIYSPSYDA